MSRIRRKLAFMAPLVGLSAILMTGNGWAQSCPADASDTGVAVLMSAFRINADGSTGPAIGGGAIGVCECIRLRMQIRYVTPGPSGGKVAFFEGGTMKV